MKLVFVQLPVMEPNWEDTGANVPLAAGYLAAYAESQGLLSRGEWSILGHDVMNYGSDSAVVSAIVDSGADLVAFSLYAWNLERSISVAARAKDLMPRARFIAGGPEVVDGMPVMDRSPFSALAAGEGELPFAAMLRDIRQHKPLARVYRPDALLDLALLPNPYLAGTLPFLKDQAVHLETMRGCPSKCSYCYYGKNYPILRYYPREQALDVIRKAGEAGCAELYLMDPSFQFGGDLEQRLRDIRDANAGKIPIHAEMRLETISPGSGDLLKEAGFASVEVGLQSINPKALEAVNRTWNRKAFERGSEILQDRKITIKTGLILGLPYDGYEQVIETFDFLGMHGLGQDTELYPLSLLPGTDVRERADEWRMSRMELPPYWVTGTDWISGDDMIDAIAAFEESFDVEWASPPSPHFSREKQGFVSFIDTRKSENIDWMRLNPSRLAGSVTLLADADDPETLSRLVRASKDIRRDNPFTLYQIVLESDTRIPSERLIERIQDAFLEPDNYYELSHYFSPDPGEGYQARMFYATRNFSLAYRAIEEAPDLETMIILCGKTGYNADRLVELLPYVIFDRESLPFDRLYELLSIYADFPHMLVEAPENLFR